MKESNEIREKLKQLGIKKQKGIGRNLLYTCTDGKSFFTSEIAIDYQASLEDKNAPK